MAPLRSLQLCHPDPTDERASLIDRQIDSLRDI
jgi:hypothetical protein